MTSNKKGASLIELILAVAVFVVGSASVAHLYIGARTAGAFGMEINQATFLAKEGIEEKRAIRNATGFDSLEESSEQVTLDNVEFARNIEFSYISDEEVVVISSVNWDSLKGEESVEISGILTDWKSGETE